MLFCFILGGFCIWSQSKRSVNETKHLFYVFNMFFEECTVIKSNSIAFPLQLVMFALTVSGKKYCYCAAYLFQSLHSVMNERSFVDFEDVAVLGQSNHRWSLEADQWASDIALAVSEPDWSIGVLAQEEHGCVSEGWVLNCFEELPWGHRWVLLRNFGLKYKINSSVFLP